MANKKHASLIREWLNGAKIQWRHNGTPWRDCDDDNPEWSAVIEYRVKPAEPERGDYPETRMTGHQLLEYFVGSGKDEDTESLVVVANKVLEHACDAGQIVTRAEFDRAVGDRKERDMAVAQAVRNADYSAAYVHASFQGGPGVGFRYVDLQDIISQVK